MANVSFFSRPFICNNRKKKKKKKKKIEIKKMALKSKLAFSNNFLGI